MACEKLSARGIFPTVVDARFAKPLDKDLILNLAHHHEYMITIEEGSVGGFGSHVMQLLSNEAIFDRGLFFRSMVMPDIFLDQANPSEMYGMAGLDSANIEARVLDLLEVTQLRSKV